jgi:hypothetical protein
MVVEVDGKVLIPPDGISGVKPRVDLQVLQSTLAWARRDTFLAHWGTSRQPTVCIGIALDEKIPCYRRDSATQRRLEIQ